jgi:hypothetical protein
VIAKQLELELILKPSVVRSEHEKTPDRSRPLFCFLENLISVGRLREYNGAARSYALEPNFAVALLEIREQPPARDHSGPETKREDCGNFRGAGRRCF